MADLTSLVRKNILALKPYSCARDEFHGEASAFLDANENPFNNPYNRYPDPLQWKLKESITAKKKVPSTHVFLGNGSDEAIDLVFRVFCEPAQDNVVAIAPTYGMYEVSADINQIEYRKVHLNDDFTLNAKKLLAATDDHTKVIFLCSPNNPSGNLLDRHEVLHVLENFGGIVVIDEAYIDFSPETSWIEQLRHFPNLIVLQTFSKAWGLAGVRLGMAFASPEIILLFNKVKYPYNVNILTQDLVLEHLQFESRKRAWVELLLKERERLISDLLKIAYVKTIYPSSANFVLVKVHDANAVYSYLVEKSIVVRNRTNVILCEGCLRITVGSPDENNLLIKVLKTYNESL
ncbi:histidinol-phosphate transaminase [Microbacter margulisiae]|uniref:Histidinol-phosphate aminotransferase n=1 Tax=Microbacter margulisiae TaxID=1350067 RepID=A0A7W5DP20_9PORP|nr:histidinol-phosphate transaminase [Microbacter margulisiae]MBB3186401.1 histidinol-phosphate aminotransferase [Microbacter margulisiae]